MATHFTGPVVSANGFTGNITGTTTGNVTGNLTGNVVGNVVGNITGNSAGTHTGAVVGTTVTATTSLAVGSGTAITKIIKGTIAVDLASTLSGAATEVTLTITGAAVGDTVIMNPVAAGNTAGLIYGGARVSTTDTVKLRVANLSGSTVDEASQTWDYCLIRA